MRESLKRLVNKLYPGVYPRNDFDILHLSSGAYNQEKDGDAHDWLDKEYSYLAGEYGSPKKLDDEVRKAMTLSSEQVIGVRLIY